MQSDLKETVVSLIVKQLHSRGHFDVVDLGTDLLRSVDAVISVCEQLVAARMDNR
jgi:hypothetical protein